jgi:hypothetical protein
VVAVSEAFQGEVTCVVVSEAEYVATIARSYMASPDGTEEQELLEKALEKACERLGEDSDELLERIVGICPIVRESEVGG